MDEKSLTKWASDFYTTSAKWESSNQSPPQKKMTVSLQQTILRVFTW